jgi:hypothetical protein
MTKSKNRQWILNARPAGKLTGEEFRWNETSIPHPSDGQALVRNLWLSVDPAQRTWMTRDSYKPKVPLGEVMQSFAVGQVLESRHPDFKPGDLVRGEFGWQDYAATDGKTFGGIQKLPPGVPPNLALSLFGLNGLTAYFGITAIGQIKAGETVVCRAPLAPQVLLPASSPRSKAAASSGRQAARKNAIGSSTRHISTPLSITSVRTSALDFRYFVPMGSTSSSTTSVVPSSTRYSRASTSRRASCCAVRYRDPTLLSRARRITSTLRQSVDAWRDSPGLIMARVFLRLSRHWAAGSGKADSCRRRTWRLASRMHHERCCACLPARISGSSF